MAHVEVLETEVSSFSGSTGGQHLSVQQTTAGKEIFIDSSFTCGSLCQEGSQQVHSGAYFHDALSCFNVSSQLEENWSIWIPPKLWVK